jgi:hypothetical protein
MAWTFQLENSTSSLNLNDGTNYKVLQQGFDAPPPALRTQFSGAGNVFRAGSRLIRQSYDNRVVTLAIQVIGSSTDNLATNIEAVESFLRGAQEFTSFSSGSQVKLKYQWDSATSPVYFHVLTGMFSPITSPQHTAALTVNTRIQNATLSLICEPFAFGAQENIENFVRDPSFEVAGTALADWTESKTATGTTARSTAQAKFGDASLLLTMTNSGGSGQVIERNQTLVDVDAGENWSFEAWIYVTALSNSKAGLVVLYNDGSATTATSYITATNTGFAQATIANQAVPSGATQAIVKVRLEATASSATGTAYVDAVSAVQAASVPTTWVSSHEVANIFTDASQLTTNYVDIHNVPGNQSALLQMKATENEAHTKFWMGARHGGRQRDTGIFHEAEDFVNTDWLVDNSDAATSAGNETRLTRVPAHVATVANTAAGSGTITCASVAVSGTRRLLVAFVASQGPSTPGTAHNTVVFNSDESMTKISDVTSGAYRLTTWVLQNPSVATAAVEVTFAAAPTQGVMVASAYQLTSGATVFYEDVDTDSGTATSGSIGQTTSIGDLVLFGNMHANTNATTPGGGLTERADQAAAANIRLATGDLIADATSETPSMSWSGSVVQLGAGVTINAGADDATVPTVLTKAISNPPRGQFRVLARVDGQGDVWSMGAGFAYGDITSTPAVPADYPSSTATAAGYEILDLGTVTIPPVATPENTTTGSFTLRVALYLSTHATGATLDLDWVMLMPIDFGSMYLSKTSGTDVVMTDSISDLRQAILLDTSSVIQSIPASQGGDPPSVHPDGTRLYFVSDNGAADTDDGFKVAITVEPRFLSVAGT